MPSTCSTRAARSPSPSERRTSAASATSPGGSRRATCGRSKPRRRRRRKSLPALLFEIGCEELPAASVYEAEAQLPGLCERQLGVAPERVLVGHRRLAVLVSGLEEET